MKLDIRRRLTLQTVALLILVCAGFAGFSAACYNSLTRMEFDENLERIWGMKASNFKVASDGQVVHAPSIKVHAKDSNFRPTFYELWSPEGELIHRSDSFRTLQVEAAFGAPDLELLKSGHGSLKTVEIEDTGIFRLKSSPLQIGKKSYLFRAAREVSEIRQRVNGLIQTMAWLLLVFSAVAFVAADWWIRKALAPVEAVRKHAQRISAQRLHERLPVVQPNDEIGQLSGTLNHLLDRLQGSFEEMKSFTSDASHELRTPLAAIRALGECTLQREDATEGELRETLLDILEEAQRLTGLTERLLTMARLDSREKDSVRGEAFDLSAHTRRIVENLEILACEKNQQIVVDLPETMTAHGDSVLVNQALTNLIDNAIKYTPENGQIRILGEADADSVRVSVVDNGPGIAGEHHALIFRRFYRVDTDRSRSSGGYGVGLAIAQKAVELSQGKMEFESEPGKGSRFTVMLRSSALGAIAPAS